MELDWKAAPAPAARLSDPPTSHEAAHDVTASGMRDAQAAACLDAATRFPGLTSAELAARMGVDRYLPACRLPELRAIGRVGW